MSNEPSPRLPRPQPGLPRTIGVLNILVALGLLLCGGGMAWAVVPFLAENSPLRLESGPTEEVVAQARSQALSDLKRRETSANDPGRREQLKKIHDDLAGLRPPLLTQVDFGSINRGLPTLGRYLWAETVSGPVLNLLLLGAGVGLIALRSWARRLAIWVAWAKIARLVVLNGYLALTVVPSLCGVMEQLLRSDTVRTVVEQSMAEAAEQQAAASPMPTYTPAEIVRLLQAFGYGYALSFAGLGLIYPVVVLVVLTRPGARDACQGNRPSQPSSRFGADTPSSGGLPADGQ